MNRTRKSAEVRVARFVLAGATLFTAGVLAVQTVSADEAPAATVTVTRTETVRQLQSFQGRKAVWWAKRTWYWKRRSIALKRTLLHRPSVVEALNLSCRVYGNCATLWRRARCESNLFPSAYNRSSSASGLLQFLPSTWQSTPFGYFSVFSPYANALAGGWMISVAGRGNEWVCR